MLFSSPVLPKCPIIFFHGLDFWILMGIFFFFYYEIGKSTSCMLLKFTGFTCVCRILNISYFMFHTDVLNYQFHTSVLYIHLPGYLPPLFLFIKQTMRSTRISKAMAHISPINQPCVAMSTCLLVIAAKKEDKIN